MARLPLERHQQRTRGVIENARACTIRTQQLPDSVAVFSASVQADGEFLRLAVSDSEPRVRVLEGDARWLNYNFQPYSHTLHQPVSIYQYAEEWARALPSAYAESAVEARVVADEHTPPPPALAELIAAAGAAELPLPVFATASWHRGAALSRSAAGRVFSPA